MRNNVTGAIGGVVFLLAMVVLLELIANGYNLKTFPGAFVIQGALAAAVGGVFFAWRDGARIAAALREDYLKRSFPSQPWLWRLDWSRRVSVAPKPTKHYTAVIAAAWNLGITPIAIACTYTVAKSSLLFLLAVLTIVVGVALFCYAMYRIWYVARLDNPALRIHTNPARPGQAFECTLGVPGFGEGIRWSSELACLCSRVETARSGIRYTTRTIVTEVWKQSFVPLVARTRRGAALALKYTVGPNAPATGYSHGGTWRWVVRVQGRNKTGILRFSREYEVPMHRDALDTVAVPNQAPSGAANAPAGAAFGMRADVPTMLGALKASGIRFSKGGVIYPDELWNQAPLVRLHATLNKACVGAFAGAGVSSVLLLVFAPWYWALPFVLLALGGAIGYGVAFYLRHRRYAVIFHKEGVTRRNWLLSRQWDTTVPWSNIQSVVWKTPIALVEHTGGESFRQLIINPDDRKTCLVLSPVLANNAVAEALVSLLRSATRHGTSR